jgi:hypothetical protein
LTITRSEVTSELNFVRNTETARRNNQRGSDSTVREERRKSNGHSENGGDEFTTELLLTPDSQTISLENVEEKSQVVTQKQMREAWSVLIRGLDQLQVDCHSLRLPLKINATPVTEAVVR